MCLPPPHPPALPTPPPLACPVTADKVLQAFWQGGAHEFDRATSPYASLDRLLAGDAMFRCAAAGAADSAPPGRLRAPARPPPPCRWWRAHSLTHALTPCPPPPLAPPPPRRPDSLFLPLSPPTPTQYRPPFPADGN